MKHKLLNHSVAVITTLVSLSGHVVFGQAARELAGSVQIDHKPIAEATVTLYAAGTGAPTKLGEAKTDNQGAFKLNAGRTPKDSVLYVVAKASKEGVELLSVLGATPAARITVNELTTVASAFTAARLINGEAISGNPLGLRIAAVNAPNLVDPATGSWGKVVLDPINITQTTTLANLNTLASLITAYSAATDNAWRDRFLKAATRIDGVTPKNTLEAMADIARAPYAQPKELFALFDEA